MNIDGTSMSSMAPALPCLNSASESIVAEDQAPSINTLTNYPSRIFPLGVSVSPWDWNVLKSNPSTISLSNSQGRSSGSGHGSLMSFHAPIHSNGSTSQHVLAFSNPAHNAEIMSGEWQQMMFSPTANTTGIMPILSPSSNVIANSFCDAVDFYANKSSPTLRPELKVSFQQILLGEEVSFMRASPPSLSNPSQVHEGGPIVDKIQSLESGWNSLEVSNTSGIAIDPSKGALALQGLSQVSLHDLEHLTCHSVFQETISMPTYYTGGTSHLTGAQAFPFKEDKNMLSCRVVSQGQPDPDTIKPLGASSCSFPEISATSNSAIVEPGYIPLAELCADIAAVKALSECVNKHDAEALTSDVVDKNDRKPASLLETTATGLRDTVNYRSHEGGSPQKEDSSTSDRIKGVDGGHSDRKRSFTEAKLKEASCITTMVYTKDKKEVMTEPASKLQKSTELAKDEETKLDRSASETSGNSTPGSAKENSKPPEPPKTDYIHVRARRGQATDSHSLAERVRREKISERMKFLQDLVPGCSKVTGKALMLDEIINYVQSLQRQVEFLSMKLAAVNSRLDLDSLVNREKFSHTPGSPAFQKNWQALQVSFSQNLPSEIQPAISCPQTQHIQTQLQSSSKGELEPRTFSEISITPSQGIPILSSTKGYAGDVSQKKSSWDCELQSIVQMGIVHNGHYPLELRELQGQLQAGQLKAES